MSGSVGTLKAVIWPAYVGVLDIYGAEPSVDYQRGQIAWDGSGAEPVGRATVLVPKGYYTHLVYFHHPLSGKMTGYQSLAHPFDIPVPGKIDIMQITKEDFTQQRTPNGFVLPIGVKP